MLTQKIWETAEQVLLVCFLVLAIAFIASYEIHTFASAKLFKSSLLSSCCNHALLVLYGMFANASQVIFIGSRSGASEMMETETGGERERKAEGKKGRG